MLAVLMIVLVTRLLLRKMRMDWAFAEGICVWATEIAPGAMPGELTEYGRSPRFPPEHTTVIPK